MNNIIAILRESQLARFLIPAGLILTIAGVIFSVVTYQSRNFVETESVITKVDLEEEAHTDADGSYVEATYTATVKYTVDGKEYEAELGGQPELKVGDPMKIFYDPSDPGRITGSKSMVIPLILTAAGVAALVAGIISLSRTVKKLKRMKEQEEEWTNV